MTGHATQGTPTSAPGVVLAVNAGSSSLKVGLYPPDGRAVWAGAYEGLEPGGSPRARLDGEAVALQPAAGASAFDAALADLTQRLAGLSAPLLAVSHRIVHGGDRCTAPCLLDAPTLAYLKTLQALAPLHQPHNLAGVQALARLLPRVPQVGCFDTAFHATLPDAERRLPIARVLGEQGLRRYGFHGLSYQYVMQSLQRITPRAEGKVVMAHLGNGSSVCAAVAGRSVATSMGYSALDGLMMGTRSGSLDPGVLLDLWRAGWDLPRVERLLYRESGLKGVSGISADMRTLRASPRPEAQEAIELYTHRLKREVGALVALLGGMDVLAFTGGIGEHDTLLRAELAAAFAFAGVRLDAASNREMSGQATQALHAPGSRVELWVVPTDEGRVAAQAAHALVSGRGG